MPPPIFESDMRRVCFETFDLVHISAYDHTTSYVWSAGPRSVKLEIFGLILPGSTISGKSRVLWAHGDIAVPPPRWISLPGKSNLPRFISVRWRTGAAVLPRWDSNFCTCILRKSLEVGTVGSFTNGWLLGHSADTSATASLSRVSFWMDSMCTWNGGSVKIIIFSCKCHAVE